MKLLVSVRDAEEASDARAGGADWIDLKEPLAGPLGAVAPDVAAAVVRTIAGLCPISAALGELVDGQTSSEFLTIPGIEVVKLGLAGCGQRANWQSDWRDGFEICSQLGRHLAAVVYADWRQAVSPHPQAVLECALRAGAKYLLLDTFCKGNSSSIEILGHARTSELLDLARQGGLTIVLAGGLRLSDLPAIAKLPVDVVAIRGAACRGNRTSRLDAAKVRHFRAQLSSAFDSAKQMSSCLTGHE